VAEGFAWVIWALNLLALPAFFFGLVAAVEYDNEHGYDTQGVTLLVALGFVAYLGVAWPAVFASVAVATGAFRRNSSWVVLGIGVWFLAIPVAMVWLVATLVKLTRSAEEAEVWARLSYLFLGSASTAALVYGAALAGILFPMALPWLAVSIWAPIHLIRTGRRYRRPPGPPFGSLGAGPNGAASGQ
jgi:hypothetical protein